MTSKQRKFQEVVDRAYDVAGNSIRMQIANHEGIQERLDTFVAVSSEERAAMWRLMSNEQRRELVIAQGVRQGKDVCEGWIVKAIELWNSKWGNEATPTEAATLDAIDTLEAEARRAAVLAVAGSDDEKYFQAEARAYDAARRIYRAGIRPEQCGAGAWHVRSESSAEVYTATKSGTCTCKAGQNGRHCKHLALIAAIETGLDNLDRFDDYVPEPDYLEAARQLFARISRARARYVEAA